MSGVRSARDVSKAERFLSEPEGGPTVKREGPGALTPVYSVRSPKNPLRYTVRLPLSSLSTSETLPAATTTSIAASIPLFTSIKWADFVSKMKNGRCYFCCGRRCICPGCTGGGAEEYDAFIGAGCGVLLSCPHCMGVEFCWYEKAYLQRFYNASTEEPRKKRLHREEVIGKRLRELGYLDTRGDRWWVSEFLEEREKREGTVVLKVK